MKLFWLSILLVACDPTLSAEGPPGPPGPSGAKGPRGLPGECSPPSLYTVEEEGKTGGYIYASCEEGDLALSGSCTWGKAPGNVHPWDERLTADNGFRCYGYTLDGTTDMVAAQVLCWER